MVQNSGRVRLAASEDDLTHLVTIELPLHSVEPDDHRQAECLMGRLVEGAPALHRRVLELRLQGVAAADVARELNISRNTVYRALELFKQRLTDCGGL